MAKMLAESNPWLHWIHQHGRKRCGCCKAGMYFSPAGRQVIRQMNRARENRSWRDDQDQASQA